MFGNAAARAVAKRLSSSASGRTLVEGLAFCFLGCEAIGEQSCDTAEPDIGRRQPYSIQFLMALQSSMTE